MFLQVTPSILYAREPVWAISLGVHDFAVGFEITKLHHWQAAEKWSIFLIIIISYLSTLIFIMFQR